MILILAILPLVVGCLALAARDMCHPEPWAGRLCLFSLRPRTP